MVVVGRRRSALQGRDRDGQDRPVAAKRHLQQSQMLVPLDAPGVNIERHAAGVRL
jgi:hypothetical protein